MNEAPNLLKKLMKYEESDYYPFHMPGHKRQWKEKYAMEFPNPFSIDITEIEGFDNLHHPEGILKESMEWASEIYGSDKTYYLINGSSCGILSAIGGCILNGETILMSRNCHKSAYHGVFLNHLKIRYVYPQIVSEFGLQGGLIPEDVENMLIKHRDIKAVLVVSPTYDGIVSDIQKVAEIVHRHGLPLIVDEAHGAHFLYGKKAGFPVSALELGADIVIQSLHKTLPSFTQTALMHVKNGYVDIKRLDRYVQMYQSSSPSYVLMAGIENCIRYMSEDGCEKMNLFHVKLEEARKKLSEMKFLKIFPVEEKGKHGVFDVDPSKIIVSTKNTGISGSQLSDILRERYHLEMEMSTSDYVTAITTLADTKEGLDRLCDAMMEIDFSLNQEFKNIIDTIPVTSIPSFTDILPESSMTISNAMDSPREKVLISKSEGRISSEFIYIYPPGIPIVAPGEVMKKKFIDMILKYKELGLSVQGMEDENAEFLFVVHDK